MESIYIIGDVHGCYKTLLALIDKLPNKENSNICFVGDLVDKGKTSKNVVEFVKSNNYPCVLGNHEMYMIDTLPLILEDMTNLNYKWVIKDGGDRTLKSYSDLNLIKEHLEWLKTLPLYLEYKDLKTSDNRHLVVSHSHILESWKYKDCDKDSKEYKAFEKDCLYSRYKSFDNSDIFNVFGHTPVQNPQINDFKANIDLGCFYKSEYEVGKLCALEFPSMKIYTQENVD
ncbi:metallophosphoesterase [Halarcobacter bivalviorum]|uniref:metallophosphoesterase n=1 Tax=Halarcobacter bivalviorum TaxID=663364 RepID=UPI00100ADB0A|nr:metallophosphoesterase [Halarcobacter bivalviorum]RXK06973.1 serine/threonine protein phosphatase [Halarcobacter bivalviorum]